MNNMLRRTKQINWEGLGKRMRTHGLSNYGPLGNNLCKWKKSNVLAEVWLWLSVSRAVASCHCLRLRHWCLSATRAIGLITNPINELLQGIYVNK